jgi:hypothetical protein
MNDNIAITKITISVLFMQRLLYLDSSRPRWGYDVSKNITNSGEEKDLANDSNQEKVATKYSFQKIKSTAIVLDSKFAKKTSLFKALSQTKMSQAPPVNSEKKASNKSGDDQGLQSNCLKEKLPWAPKPKLPKKNRGNIV